MFNEKLMKALEYIEQERQLIELRRSRKEKLRKIDNDKRTKK